MTYRLDIRGLRIETRDGKMLVDGIDLCLEAGGVAALVGESGSGKTLTALAVLGLLPAAVRRTLPRNRGSNPGLRHTSATTA